MRHELFDELDAACPRWQTKFRSITAAAYHYGADTLLRDFLKTPEGKLYLARVSSVHDYMRDNEMRARQLQAERAMATQGAAERNATALEHVASHVSFHDSELPV